MCLVSVGQCNSEPVVCVYGSAGWELLYDSMTLARRRNCLMMHFSERIPVVKKHVSVMNITYH